MYEFDWSSIPGALPFLWQGMMQTLQITFVAIVVGIVLGTLIALMRLSKNRSDLDPGSILCQRVSVNSAGHGPTLVLPIGSQFYKHVNRPSFHGYQASFGLCGFCAF